MIIRSDRGAQKGLRKKTYPLMVVGVEHGAFISKDGWLPNLLAVGVFALRWLCCETAAKAKVLEGEFPNAKTTADYKAAVKEALAEVGEDLVVCVCTPVHAPILKELILLGVKKLMVEKPPVEKPEEWQEIETLASEHGVQIFVSFQHECNAPTDCLARMLREHVEMYGAGNATVFGSFLQSWILEGTTNWRLKLLYPGLTDILTHAVRGTCRIAGSRIKRVIRSCHGKGRRAMRDLPAMDHGSVAYQFENGVMAHAEYSQVEPGAGDDISWGIELRDPNTGRVRRFLWHLRGGADSLWEGDVTLDPRNPLTWKIQHVRGNSPIFRPEEETMNSKQPGGHTQGWGDMYVFFFLRCYQRFLKADGEELANYLKPSAYGHLPDFEHAGFDCMLFVGMTIQSFETGEEVNAADYCAAHRMTPPGEPVALVVPSTSSDVLTPSQIEAGIVPTA